MNRFRSMLLVSLCLLVPLSAHATKLRQKTLYWHTSLASQYTYSAGDSLNRIRDGSTVASADEADTTGSFSTLEWVMPGPQYGTTVASDSVTWLRVTLFAVGSAPTVTGDSIAVKVQVSDAEEQGWTTTVWTGPKISPLFTAMTAGCVLETGTSNTFEFPIRQVLGGATQSVFDYLGTGAPTTNQIYGFSNVRFIIAGDHAGKWQVRLTGFVPDNQP